MAFETFEELEVWKLSREIKNEVKELTNKFPKEEKYRLVDQIIRSSRAVGANIAEGFGRFHYKENLQFCRMARGSLFETLNHLIDAYDNNLISKEKLDYYRGKIQQTTKVLNGYIAYIKKQIT